MRPGHVADDHRASALPHPPAAAHQARAAERVDEQGGRAVLGEGFGVLQRHGRHALRHVGQLVLAADHAGHRRARGQRLLRHHRADRARGAHHDDVLALLDPADVVQRHVRRRRGDEEARRHPRVERCRQRRDRLALDADPLGPRAVPEQAEAAAAQYDLIAGCEAGVGVGLQDRARALDPADVRQRRLQLEIAGGDRRVEVRDTARRHLDEYLSRRADRLGHLVEDRGGAPLVEPYGPHQPAALPMNSTLRAL